MFSQVIVYGAGAVGSAYGAILSKHLPVTLVTRNQAHIQAVQKNGLKLTGELSETFHPTAAYLISEIMSNTLVILSTKCFDVAQACHELKDLVQADTVVLCIQNGLGSIDEARKILPCSVLQGISRIAVTFPEPGRVNVSSFSALQIEPSSLSSEIAELFSNTIANVFVEENFKQEIWLKLTNASIMNPLTTILRVRYSELIHPYFDEMASKIFKECQQVAGCENIAIPDSHLTFLLERLRKISHKTSMLQDFENKRKTEIDYLNGAVVRLGKKHKISTPVNEFVVSMVKFLEEKNGCT
ncbi:MAG: 2-dehydropantoate 2-reductase [Candidatus Diapherotrites archaeon]|nr:2-dehydropantoate 2-reductase [Candidatus Diapherotrites archaeon]